MNQDLFVMTALISLVSSLGAYYGTEIYHAKQERRRSRDLHRSARDLRESVLKLISEETKGIQGSADASASGD